MIEEMSRPRINNVIDFEKYFNKRIDLNPPKQTPEKETVLFDNNNVSKNNNGGVLEIELIAPQGYEAKVVNAKSSDGRDFKVKLRGKRKQ